MSYIKHIVTGSNPGQQFCEKCGRNLNSGPTELLPIGDIWIHENGKIFSSVYPTGQYTTACKKLQAPE